MFLTCSHPADLQNSIPKNKKSTLVRVWVQAVAAKGGTKEACTACPHYDTMGWIGTSHHGYWERAGMPVLELQSCYSVAIVIRLMFLRYRAPARYNSHKSPYRKAREPQGRVSQLKLPPEGYRAIGCSCSLSLSLSLFSPQSFLFSY